MLPPRAVKEQALETRPGKSGKARSFDALTCCSCCTPSYLPSALPQLTPPASRGAVRAERRAEDGGTDEREEGRMRTAIGKGGVYGDRVVLLILLSRTLEQLVAVVDGQKAGQAALSSPPLTAPVVLLLGPQLTHNHIVLTAVHPLPGPTVRRSADDAVFLPSLPSNPPSLPILSGSWTDARKVERKR